MLMSAKKIGPRRKRVLDAINHRTPGSRADGLRRVGGDRHPCQLRRQAQGPLRPREAAGESVRALSDARPRRGRPQGGDRDRRHAADGPHQHVRLRQPRLEALDLQRPRCAGAGRVPRQRRAGEGRHADLPEGRHERAAERAHAEGRVLLRFDHPPEADRSRPPELRGQRRAVHAADRGRSSTPSRRTPARSTPATMRCSLRW